uniref:Uncharacterized protein n=1 Tax=Rhizophora mucronata TaxID=61149 RepID=A0A2P2QYW3_RHIMU
MKRRHSQSILFINDSHLSVSMGEIIKMASHLSMCWII